MQIVTSIVTMQRLAKRWQRQGARIGLVPTMGYLHEGHLSLVRQARQGVGPRGRVVVSIYVNPTQFGPKEDFSCYPRDLNHDLKLCRAADVNVVFAPADEEMYPGRTCSRRCKSAEGPRFGKRSYSTYVVEEQLSRVMDGVSRPGHFRGVTTVVAKLFNIVLPDLAVFGAKDFQQAMIIQRMVADLNFPVNIIVAPTVREPDGVAMSSRNKYLVGILRPQAVVLHQSIQRVKAAVRKSSKPVPDDRLRTLVRNTIKSAPAARLDYVEFFDPKTLSAVTKVSRGTHLALAVFVGPTRLIDNGRL